MNHTCHPPHAQDRQGRTAWNCPKCGSRFIWSKRMIRGEMREGWTRGMETLADRHRRNIAEMNREFRPWFIASAAVVLVGSIVLVALIVWIVLRVT